MNGGIGVATVTSNPERVERRGGGAAALGPVDWATLLILTLAVGWAYAPNLRALVAEWSDKAEYSHGFLIIPIALKILWDRRERLDRAKVKPLLWAWPLVLGVLALRSWLFERNELWVENLTLLPLLVALVLALGGWHVLKLTWSAITFLIFMFPLPPSLNLILAAPLQRLATIGSTAILQAMGLPALSEGNLIALGPHTLEVAEVCNGLSMLQAFLALIVAVTILSDVRTWEKVVLLLSAVPIALISNILRIVVTGTSYYYYGPDAVIWGKWSVKDIEHAAAGWAMMPIALAMVWLELKILSWLVIEERSSDRPVAPMAVPNLYPASSPPAKKKP